MGAAGYSVTAAVRDARRGEAHGGEAVEASDAGTERAEALLDELAAHMRAAGELTAAGEVHVDDGDLMGTYVLEQKAKLVVLAGADAAYVVPSSQDWAHDALGQARVAAAGTVFSDGEPFLEGEACVSGYFQADAGGRWARVVSGRVALGAKGVDWRDSLEEFPEVMEQLEECMSVSAWRHVAEQAALKSLASAGECRGLGMVG